MTPTTHLAASCLTDIGQRRSRNEDVCSVNIEHQYFMVADGVGGSQAGDIASSLFLKAVSQTYQEKTDQDVDESKEQVKACFSLANTMIREHIAVHRLHSGMGTTAELLTICGDMFVLGHVGDSRTFRCYNNTIEQLTTDHSLVQEQVDRGVISKKQASESKFKNVLLRVVSGEADLEVDISYGKIRPGTIFLLCTDGLYNMVTVDQIRPVLSYDAPLSFKTEMLVNMANDAGGRDNISVALVEIGNTA